MADPSTPQTGQDGEVQGEGDYVSARRYQKAQHAFAKSGKVEAGAKAAEAALDGPEGEELERAREQSARGEPRGRD
jgi:hypothetical protein